MSRLRRALRALPRLALAALLGAVLLSVVQVALARVLDPPLTFTMIGAILDHHEFEGEWRWPTRQWRDLDALGRRVPRAVVASEDARFWLHRGFDWEGICAAVQANADSKAEGDGGRLRGGSTITQQAARNVFLWQEQSWLRKGLETWYALLMELLLPKERILELYLNVAETGILTFGVQAGAWRYWQADAADLSAEQAARLAAVLPSPRKWSVNGATASKRAAWIQENPAPWPDQDGFQETRRRWLQQAPGPGCLLRR